MIELPNRPDFKDGLGLLGLIGLVVVAVWWLHDSSTNGTQVKALHTGVAATVTALATGFGAVPFLFLRRFNDHWLNVGNALAAGLMLGASVGLVWEGARVENVDHQVWRLAAGMALGAVLISLVQSYLHDHEGEYSIEQIQGADAIKVIMVLGVMTAHSFAEGVGVGVSFGEDNTFGSFISAAIAIHNIPEGLAISLVLIPRGTSVTRAGLWSVFSSLPQPLMAVPAFLFVWYFRPFLPVGLGLAAGAMLWMVFKDLLPEALERSSPRVVFPLVAVAVAGMLYFQYLVG